jgi:pentatricopeptide repeat protein
MTNEELEKLKKKIEKDPQPSFSILLADEYKKRDMLDEAEEILLQILDNRPDYTSARVALGKIYLHKEMLFEARKEFEKVVKLIPNNLLAHKKLVDIYCRLKEYDSAMEECQTILNINPDDDEIKALMISLISPTEVSRPASTDKSATADLPVEAGKSAPEEETAISDDKSTFMDKPDTTSDLPVEAGKPATDHDSSIEAGKSDDDEPASGDESPPEDKPVPPEEAATPRATEDIQTEEEPATDHEFSIEAGKSDDSVPVYEIPEKNDDSELDVELPQTIIPVSEGPVNRELQEFRKIMDTQSQTKPLEKEEQKDDNADGILDNSASADESATTGKPEDAPKDVDGSATDHDSSFEAGKPAGDEERDEKIVISMPTNTMADIFIGQGHYNKAMDIYNEMLSSDPDNKKIAQRREELKMLIRISDKK